MWPGKARSLLSSCEWQVPELPPGAVPQAVPEKAPEQLACDDL